MIAVVKVSRTLGWSLTGLTIQNIGWCGANDSKNNLYAIDVLLKLQQKLHRNQEWHSKE